MKGARTEMPRLTQAFEGQLISAQSMDDLLIESIDHLAEGVGSSLLHSLIHLGYGLHAFETIGKSNRTDDTADSTLGRALLAEGLAYNVYGFTSFGRHDALEKADYTEAHALADATLLEESTLVDRPPRPPPSSPTSLVCSAAGSVCPASCSPLQLPGNRMCAGPDYGAA
jgi:hypothetical protein